MSIARANALRMPAGQLLHGVIDAGALADVEVGGLQLDFSISLGVLNLMPVPILDGGHVFFYLLEWVKGGPISEQAIGWGQRVGVTLLLGLMMLAFYNDITRILG